MAKINISVLFLVTLYFMFDIALCDHIKDDTFYKLLKSKANVDNPPDICYTTACENAGIVLRDSIDSSVDPCDDFYEFACGGWKARHTIPENHTKYDSYDIVGQQILNSLKRELSAPPKLSDPISVVYALNLYNACIESSNLELRGVSPLKTAINSIGGWPIIEDNFKYYYFYDWKDSFVKMIGHLSMSFIFLISVRPDIDNPKLPSANRIHIEASDFGIAEFYLSNLEIFEDEINAYKEYILQTAILLGAKNNSQTHKDIEDIIDFESQLAKLSTKTSSFAFDSEHMMSIKEFTHLSNSVDWLNLINRIYSSVNSTILLSNDERIIVKDVNYFKEVTKLLENTPNRVIANYFGWMSAMSFGEYTNKQFRDNKFEFDKKVLSVQEVKPLWKTCISQVSKVLEYAVNRKYIDENFINKDKEEVTQMVNKIKKSFHAFINERVWLNEETKNKALNKLNAMSEDVAYPDWILNNDELDNLYKLKQKVDPKKYFESIVYVKLISKLNEIEYIRKPNIKSFSKILPLTEADAQYEFKRNTLSIPMGIMQSPFYHKQLPAYMNFGSIGFIIGHEIAHGFDDYGRDFDENGRQSYWWKYDMLALYDKKSNCFIKEYNNYYDSEAKMDLSGDITLGENIADNAGIREAFKSYQSYIKQHGKQQRLPYVSQYTNEQIFFLSFANMWCSNIKTEELQTWIETRAHNPDKYRVNIPVSNFKKFSQVYGCEANSKMNPKNKCVLW